MNVSEQKTKNRSLAALPADLKMKNHMAILNAFRSGQPLSANDVANSTGISRQTVMKAINGFREKGLLASAGKGESTEIGGKKPELFYFCMEQYLMCIGLESSRIAISLYNLKGEQITRNIRQMNLKFSLDKFFELIDGMIEEIFREIPEGKEKLYGISLFVGGIVDYADGILKFSALSPDWGYEVPLGEMLRQRFPGVVVEIDNVAKVSACATVLDNGELAQKRVVVLYSDEGISACYIDRGNVLHGPNNLIGEIGHMIVDIHDTQRCGCGSFGCFERQVSKERIREMAGKDPQKLSASKLQHCQEKMELADVFEAADAGDLLAKELTGYMAEMFCHALRNISLNFDQEVVVLQGIFSHAGTWFDLCLKKKLQEFQYYSGQKMFEIRYDTSPLMQLQMTGATKLLAKHFFASPEWL